MTAVTEQQRTDVEAVFSRILVGIDGSEESREAARQAAIVAEGELTLLAAYDLAAGLVGGTGIGVPAYYDDDAQRKSAQAALARAREEIPAASATGKIVRGAAWDALIREAERERDTLIAVGSHGAGRLAGIVMGSVATEVIHKAPCSVLVARKGSDPFPSRIVVGVDGSPESTTAYEVARRLAARFTADLWPLVVHGGKGVDTQVVDQVVGSRREDLVDDPVPALVAAAADAELLVVGSRGLHGLKSLGSVSEQVAHRARSSVLIVRDGGRRG